MSAVPRARLRDTAAWLVVAFFAVAIAAYAMTLVIVGERMFPPQLKLSFNARPWGIYPHAFFSAVALAVGATQFRRQILIRRRRVHRVLGRVYVVCVLAAGATGFYMALYAFGGLVTKVGFAALGALLLFTTVQAFLAIRAGDVSRHREWMLRSYALIFAGVTLRIELPLLIVSLRSFLPAYRIVSWLAWVPNLAWAEWYIRRTRASVTPIPAPVRADKPHSPASATRRTSPSTRLRT